MADGAWARWKGTEPNRRLSGSLALSWRASHMWRIGVAGRAFGFEKDLGDGYFDPDFYGHIEAALLAYRCTTCHDESVVSRLVLMPHKERVRYLRTKVAMPHSGFRADQLEELTRALRTLAGAAWD